MSAPDRRRCRDAARRSSRSAAGTGWPRRCSALRRVTERPDRGGHGRRRRRLQRPAARASSASCRPATCGWRWPRCAATTTGAAPGREVVQHRFRSDGELHEPRGRQPADRRAVGAARATRSPGWTGWPGCSARRAGCCRCRSVPLDIEAEVEGLDPAIPPRSTVRGQVAVAAHHRPGRVSVALVPADPPACPEAVAGGRWTPTGWCSGRARGSPA